MKKQRLIALGLFLAVAVWMLFPRPQSSSDSEGQEQQQANVLVVPENASVTDDSGAVLVRAARLYSQTYVENVRVRGRTQSFRSVQVRAEVNGRVVATPLQEGARVKLGDTLCELSIDNRDADLLEARSRREQTKFEYDAALDLEQQGLQSSIALAQAKAAYDSAVAAVSRAELALANTQIKAPFDGILETRIAEIGDLLERGGVCGTVMDDTPMLLVGLIPEQDIGKLQLGASVTARLITGTEVTGRVTYLALSGDEQSRSYRVEAEVVSSNQQIREGITAEIFVAAAEVQAHVIPASALTLNDQGNVGIKYIGNDNIVGFQEVNIIGDQTSLLDPGIWVTGLPDQVTLITRGQEIVFPGQRVQVQID